jgi:dTMP kinase
VKGLLITLEGIDGSGKSTAARHIASRLQALLPERKLILTAEPTKGPAGKILREKLSGTDSDENPMGELFLFMADHADHLTRLVIPSLEENAIVISDRYADSTAAYQGVTMKDVIPDPVAWIQSIYAPWNLPPDKTLLFDIDPKIAVQRMQSRKGREKFERLEFLQSVDENFHRLAAQEPERFILIDASANALDVTRAAMEAIQDLISNCDKARGLTSRSGLFQ